MTTGLTVLVVIASVLVCVLAIIGYGFFRVCLSARAQALAQADEFVERHFRALDVLLDDPGTPDVLAAFAVHVSRLTANPEEAERVLATVAGVLPMPNQDVRSRQSHTEVLAAAEDIRAHRPDLYTAFADVVVAGTLGGASRHVAIFVSPLRVFREMRLLTRAKAKSALMLDNMLRAFDTPDQPGFSSAPKMARSVRC